MPGDIGTITRLHGILYPFGKSFEAYVASTLGEFYDTINPENERMWLATYHDRIIGSIALKNANDWAQLRYFLVAPAYRGIGLGKRLITCFSEFMKACEYTKSFLLTEEQLLTAAALYKNMGYQYASSSETSFGLTELRYELHL